MASMWFLVPYKRDDKADTPTRYCAMCDYPGFVWEEVEIDGDRALVKVSGKDEALALLPFPKLAPTSSGVVAAPVLGVAAGKLAVSLDAMQKAGRRAPRYDALADKIVCDGELQPVKDWRDVEERIR